MIRTAMAAAAIILAGLALTPGQAKADPPYGYGYGRGYGYGHGYGWRGRGWCCGRRYVYPAPVVIVRPGVVYAPPPVVYAPPPVIYAPPAVSFGVTVPIR